MSSYKNENDKQKMKFLKNEPGAAECLVSFFLDPVSTLTVE